MDPPKSPQNAPKTPLFAIRAAQPVSDEGVFPIARSVGHKRNAREGRKRRDKRRAKMFISPANARFLADYIPEPGETCHVVTRGDFCLGDWLPLLCERRGPFQRLTITTLSANPRNVRDLVTVATNGGAEQLTLWLSNYFLGTDKANTPAIIEAELAPLPNVTVAYARIHTKLILAESERDALVYAGSANLRSSNTVEQTDIYNDPDLLAFHLSWIATLDA